MLKKDSSKEEIYQEVVRGELKELLKVNPDVFSDRDFVKDLVHGNGYVLKYLPLYLRDDEKIIKHACHATSQAVNFASERIVSHKELWGDICEENPNSYNCLLEREEDIKNKKQQSKLIIEYANEIEELNNEIDEIRERIGEDKIFNNPKEEKVDLIREKVIEKVKENGLKIIEFKDYQNDEEVILAACKNDPRAFYIASSTLKNNNSFLIKLIKANGCLEIMDSISVEKCDKLISMMTKQKEHREKIINTLNQEVPRQEMSAKTPDTKRKKTQRINQVLSRMEEESLVYNQIDNYQTDKNTDTRYPIPREEKKNSIFERIKLFFQGIGRKEKDTYDVKQNNYQYNETGDNMQTEEINARERFKKQTRVTLVQSQKHRSQTENHTIDGTDTKKKDRQGINR